jgi:VanZ family protein
MIIFRSILRWLPAIIVMAVIFWFSSIPSKEIPSFGGWDLVVKKGGHIAGYSLLALAYSYGTRFNNNSWYMVLSLALLFAISDEFHQSLVPGRHPSWVDVFFFDGGGAVVMLLAISRKNK